MDSSQRVRAILSFVQAAKSRTLDRCDVNEYVLSAVTWLYETVALMGLEPFHSSVCHSLSASRSAKPRKGRVPPRAANAEQEGPGRVLNLEGETRMRPITSRRQQYKYCGGRSQCTTTTDEQAQRLSN